MGLARCGKMILPGMVYMSQTRIIEVLQCRKDEANELMLLEITVQLPIFPSSLISFHYKNHKNPVGRSEGTGSVIVSLQSHTAAMTWMAVVKK